MNYIGSKRKLAHFIKEIISDHYDSDLEPATFCDLFAGTGTMGRVFKPLVKTVIANDVEPYSYVLNRHYIGNFQALDIQPFLDQLNDLEGHPGLIFEHYCQGGGSDRLYFSDENGQKN